MARDAERRRARLPRHGLSAAGASMISCGVGGSSSSSSGGDSTRRVSCVRGGGISRAPVGASSSSLDERRLRRGRQSAAGSSAPRIELARRHLRRPAPQRRAGRARAIVVADGRAAIDARQQRVAGVDDGRFVLLEVAARRADVGRDVGPSRHAAAAAAAPARRRLAAARASESESEKMSEFSSRTSIAEMMPAALGACAVDERGSRRAAVGSSPITSRTNVASRAREKSGAKPCRNCCSACASSPAVVKAIVGALLRSACITARAAAARPCAASTAARCPPCAPCRAACADPPRDRASARSIIS